MRRWILIGLLALSTACEEKVRLKVKVEVADSGVTRSATTSPAAAP